jgi:hypothetical protein
MSTNVTDRSLEPFQQRRERARGRSPQAIPILTVDMMRRLFGPPLGIRDLETSWAFAATDPGRCLHEHA